MNRKKIVAVCMLLAILIGISPQEYAVASESLEYVHAIQPRYSNLQDATLGFGVDASTGEAYATLICVYYTSCTDYVQARLELQQYTEERGWTTIYTTITNLRGNPSDTGFTRKVPSGAYRTVATMDFYYNNAIVETIRLASVADSY